MGTLFGAVWLGDIKLADSVYPFASLLLLSLPPFVVFQGLKEQIEMVSPRPFNLYILMIALCTILGVFYLGEILFSPNAGILYGYLFAFLISAVLSVLCVKHHLAPFGYYAFPKLLLISVVVFLMNRALVAWLSAEATYLNVIAVTGSLILSVTGIFVFLCLYRPSPFVREMTIFALPAKFRPLRADQG